MPDISQDNQDACTREPLTESFVIGAVTSEQGFSSSALAIAADEASPKRRRPSYSSRHGCVEPRPYNPPIERDGFQKWYRLILNDLGRNHSEAVIHPYETWSEPSAEPEPVFNGVRGEGDIEANRLRAARRAKRSIRFACKTAEFDRMVTLTTKDNFTRKEIQRLVENFIKLLRQACGGKIDYIVVPEKHDSEKTSESKRGSHHVHIAIRGRQDYKLLVSIWHYRICNGRGFVHVSNPFNKRTGKAYTAAQMASYLYKYVSKNLSGAEFNKKSYWVSQNIAPPARTVLLFRTYSEAFQAALEHFQTLGLAFGTEKHRCWRDEGLDVLWLAAG